MTRQEKIREGIARWLFTFVREREDMKLNWEQTKGYYLQEADLLLEHLGDNDVVIKGQGLGISHPHLANYFTVEPLI